jgi:DNA repair exonuclease SbcCD ATPase subunit
MIINGVRAENVLKYSVLRLDEIPTRGLIAVIGDNESGKSSIGESICFALFGRTFSLHAGELDKLIRWGESRCSIRLDFTTPDGQRYQVARFLDELGNHGASLSRAGEDPMVRGVAEVSTSLKEIIGFGYTEFIESFYLAQREITTPHPHSFAVKAMAGVDTLEKVSAGCGAEIALAERQSTETADQQADIEAQITAIGLEEGLLEALERERMEAQAALEGARNGIATLKARAEQHECSLADLAHAADLWLAVPPTASLAQREVQAARLEGALSGLQAHCDDGSMAKPFSAVAALARDIREPLDDVSRLFSEVAAYRGEIGRLLGQGAPPQAQPARSDHSAEIGNGDERPTFGIRRQALDHKEAAARASRRVVRVTSALLVIFALVGWGTWGVLGLGEEGLGPALAGLVSRLRPWEPHLLPWLPYGAAVLTALALAMLVRAARLTSRLRVLGAEKASLSTQEADARQDYLDLEGLEELPLQQACARIESLEETRFPPRATALVTGPASVLVDPEADRVCRESFGQRLEALQLAIAQQKKTDTDATDRLHEAVTLHASTIARLGGQIEQEAQRVRRHRELSEIARMLQSRNDELRRRVRVREMAMELLAGAIHYISQRFNTEIRNLAADSLPKFTNGRYEHLQIDENLKVKAFSNEKRNFMDLDEISSGTQRQIMLAVRLALSQKLVNSVIQGPQMLFLDEPFAFFDEGRTASSLAVLPQVSQDFTQIWVTSQTFPAQARFDLSIECDAKRLDSPTIRRGAEAVQA